MIINERIKVNETKNIPDHHKKSTGIIGCKVGDTIVDTKSGLIGKVVKIGTSGNYDVAHIDFEGTIRKVKPMDDAQVHGRYQFSK